MSELFVPVISLFIIMNIVSFYVGSRTGAKRMQDSINKEMVERVHDEIEKKYKDRLVQEFNKAVEERAKEIVNECFEQLEREEEQNESTDSN